MHFATQKAIDTPCFRKIGVVLRRMSGGLFLLLFFACGREQKQDAIGGGNPNRGKEAIERYGCNACHIIPGIPGPKGKLGPPLEHVAARAYIAGRFPNKPETMIKWLQNPPAFDPQTTMPSIGITESDSRDITAYLYTLK